MIAPPASDDADLIKTVEEFAVEQFVAQASVKTFDVTIFPRAARFDIEGGDAEPAKPFPHGIGDELGTVIRPDVFR